METEKQTAIGELSSPESPEIEKPSPKLAELPIAKDDQERGYIKCLICGCECHQAVEMEEADGSSTFWLHCLCGSIFNRQKRQPYDKTWPAAYREEYLKARWLDARYMLLERMYLPLIEELTQGRKFLDVGFTVPLMIERMKDRGWVSSGIDLYPNDYLTGDFESFDFGLRKYDFILMTDILQCFNMPVMTLQKAQRLLNPNGILLILTPDAEAIYLIDKPPEFGQFRRDPNRTLWSKRQLEKQIMQLGMNLIMSYRNIGGRGWNAFSTHLMAQKDPYGLHEIEETDLKLMELNKNKEQQNG